MMSAPSAIMRLACANARSGAMNCPPSENESGVTFSTPITAGIGRDKRSRSREGPAAAAAGAGLELVAIMRSLCAVGACESRCGAGELTRERGRFRPDLIGDFRLQLARLR